MQMQLKLLVMPLVVCLLNSCASGPKVTACVSDPAAGGFDCYDENTQVSSFLPYAASDKYVAFNPSDAQTLLNYCATPSAVNLSSFKIEDAIAFIREKR